MKVFATNFLTDYLRDKIKHYEPEQIECKFFLHFHHKDLGFANHVAYVICREIDLADLGGFSFLSLVRDGHFGKIFQKIDDSL